MYCGFDTQAAFIGHSPGLRAAIDKVSALKFESPDPPAALEYMFRYRMVDALIGNTDVRGEDVRYLEMIYAAVDDNVLKYAIASGHVRTLIINDRGYYLANGKEDGGIRR
jgi:hypothetical protein